MIKLPRKLARDLLPSTSRAANISLQVTGPSYEASLVFAYRLCCHSRARGCRARGIPDSSHVQVSTSMCNHRTYCV